MSVLCQFTKEGIGFSPELQHWHSSTWKAFLGQMQREGKREVDKYRVTPLFLCTETFYPDILICWEKNHVPIQMRLCVNRPKL